jgi:probable addiction module antidote protein
MTTIQTHPWDPSAHLKTREDIAAYIEAALEDGDPSIIAAALGDISRSQGMTQIARETGLGHKIMESMTIQADRDVLNEGIKIAQTRLAEIENSTVQTIPGDIALAQVRQLLGQ